MYISRRFYALVGIALIGVVLAVAAESGYILYKKNEIANLRDSRIQAVRESINLHDAINDLIQYSNTIGSSALSTDDGRIGEFDRFHNGLETLLEEASQQVKSYTSGDLQKWNEFLQRWNIWYINELGLLHRIEGVTAASPSLTIEGFREYITKEKQGRLEMAVGLRKSTIGLIKESVRKTDELLSITDDINFIVGTKMGAVLIFVSVVVFFYISNRNYYKKHAAKIKNLLNSIMKKNKNETVSILNEMINKQKISLKATTSKVKKIDVGLEILCRGISQVSADQINLFSLNNALERAQSLYGVQGGNLYGVSGETAALAEQACVLANEVRMMADQIKALLGEVVTELQEATVQIDLPSTPPNAQIAPRQADKFVNVLTKVTGAMNADPLQAMITPRGQEIRDI